MSIGATEWLRARHNLRLHQTPRCGGIEAPRGAGEPDR